MGAFDDWLQQLAAAGKGGALITDADMPPATRGLDWKLPSIVMTGNWTGAAIEGSISASPDASSPLLTFTVGSATYNAGTGQTSWAVSLTASQVNSLPADADGDGIEKFPTMFRITPSGGVKELLFGCLFSVVGKA